MSTARTHGRSTLGLWFRRQRLRWIRITNPALRPLRVAWRSSLKLRTMTITGIIAVTMVTVMGALVLDRISTDLYSSRRDQALHDSARATLAAQAQMDRSDAVDISAMNSLAGSVRSTVQGTSSSQLIYVRRQADQPSSTMAPDDFYSSPELVDAVTTDLTQALIDGNAPQYWQAVRLAEDSGSYTPGILVASTIMFPSGAGSYDLFIGYSLADVAQSIEVITRALVVMALLLLLLLAILVWVISSLVFRPIQAAASASHRLAAGEADARIPLQADRHFDELSSNFNHMADTLQARIDELDQLSEMQQRFVSDVSHELRTPLTTIRLAAEVLRSQSGDDNSAQARPIQVLGDQVERFELLLADLLEISRYDAGPVTLETEPTNLVILTEKCVEELRPLSPSLIELRPLGGYTTIEVDARRIRRIISNLVGNAIEHGEGQPIVVTIDSNASAIAIGVRDWGVGMTHEAMLHVFDRFWRADPSRKRTFGGTGLGLAIAQEDAAAHGGLLEVWSRVGEGSNFRVTLPRRAETAAFVSPVPLIPDDVTPDEGDPEVTGGWLRRPGRRVRREKRK